MNKEIKNRIAFMIRSFRGYRCLSQQQLADKSGVSHATISAIERGEANVTISSLVELCNALDLVLDISMFPAEDVNR